MVMVNQLIFYNQQSTILSFSWVSPKYIWEVTWPPTPKDIPEPSQDMVKVSRWLRSVGCLKPAHKSVITSFYRSCEQMAEFPILPADSCDDVISWVSDSFCSQCLNKNQRHCQSYLCSTLCVPNGTLFRKSYHCKVFLFELNQCISIYTIMVYVH